MGRMGKVWSRTRYVDEGGGNIQGRGDQLVWWMRRRVYFSPSSAVMGHITFLSVVDNI